MSEITGFSTVDCYKYILEWASKHKGNTPSQRQIAAGCGFSGSTAYYHIQILIKRGLLERIDGELCVVRSHFALDDNAHDVFNKGRPKILDMKHIPKDMRGLSKVEMLGQMGIITGDAVDPEFLAAQYPPGWRYQLINQNGSADSYLLYDDQEQAVAFLRYCHHNHEATINFVA